VDTGVHRLYRWVGVRDVVDVMTDTLFDALLLCLLFTVATLILGLPLVMVGAHVARERHPQEYADWAAEESANPPTPPLFKPPSGGITGDAHARTRRTEEEYYAEFTDNDTPHVDLYDTGVCNVPAEPEHDGRLGWTVRHG